jgi:hypothetical protein
MQLELLLYLLRLQEWTRHVSWSHLVPQAADAVSAHSFLLEVFTISRQIAKSFKSDIRVVSFPRKLKDRTSRLRYATT